MIESLDISVARVPSGSGPQPGPAIVVGPAGQAVSTAELYRRLSGASAGCRAGKRMAAIVSTGALNTPDQVSVTGSRRYRDSFDLDLEIRRFDGPMAANDPWLALIRMELGLLEPGSYRLTVHETAMRFTDIRHPETATEPMTTERSFGFVCVRE